MGRVYNALVKADRLPGRDPIGRPESDDAATSGDAQPSRANSSNLPAFDFETATQTATDSNRASSNAFNHEDENRITSSYEDEYRAASFEFENNTALSESFIGRQPAQPVVAPRTKKPVAPQAVDQLAASPRPRVAAPPQFVEPREIVNVKSLTLNAHLAALTASDALACERYRTLAVRTVALATRRKAKTLLVTSADDGEGKSTIAANLAWVMAQRTERRVLLMDVNLRAPSLGRLLKVAPARGWLEMKDVATELPDAIVRLDPNGLYVMLPQGAHQNASLDGLMLDEALASARFEKLMAALVERFDFIVLDGSALLASADAQQLAALTDGTIMVARAATTPHRRVTDALELVPQERRFGIVLNEAEVAESTSPRKGARRLFGRVR